MSLVRSAIIPTLALTAVCAVVAGLVSGETGVYGAIVGGVIVCVFFASSPLALGPVTKVSPQSSVLVAMVFFLTKVVALVALFVVVLGPDGIGDHVDDAALGMTVIVTTLAWTALQIRAARHTRQPLYDLSNSEGRRPDNLKGQ
jgi:ATP synthase protein I